MKTRKEQQKKDPVDRSPSRGLGDVYKRQASRKCLKKKTLIAVSSNEDSSRILAEVGNHYFTKLITQLEFFSFVRNFLREL